MLLEPGKIITFYSYKGGTGRTMALANVACLLAQEKTTDNRPVLMIDWDLEAPGLHRFFRDQLSEVTAGELDKDERLDKETGLLDFFLKLRDATYHYDEKHPQRQADARELLEHIRPEDFVLRTDISGLLLLKAGCIDDAYSKNVNTFGWEGFYNRAPWLIRSFSERLAKLYRYVLIDARTGLTDVSGICTMLLPETLVFVFTPNRQSIRGGIELIRRATNYRRSSSDFRPLVVFPLVSRVEPARDALRRDWRMGNPDKGIEGFQPQFQTLFKEVYQLKECSLEDYFQEIQIQHNPDYAYGEVIAAQIETTEDRLSLKRSYRTFVERLTSSPSPWQREEVPVKTPESEATRTIFFANGNSAPLLVSKPDMSVRDIARSLQLNNASALFLIVEATESAEGPTDERLSSLLTNSLSRIVGDVEAIVLDRGIELGAAKLVGEGVAHRGRGQNLLGVAPRNQVTYPGQQETSGERQAPLDANHTHFVLVEGQEWGDEVELKCDLARELARDTTVVSILVGGDSSTLKELFRIVKQQWPIIVVDGSGELANEIAVSYKAFDPALERERSSKSFKKDEYDKEDLRSSNRANSVLEIAAEGNISVFPTNGDAAMFERMIYRCLPDGRALDLAWDRFVAYDREATRRYKSSRRLQLGFLIMGILGVIATLGPFVLVSFGYFRTVAGPGPEIQRVLSLFFLIGMIVLFQLFDYQRPDKLAEELKHAAETIKSEIFQYRTQTGKYRKRQPSGMPAATALVETLDSLQKTINPPGAIAPTSREEDWTIPEEGFGFLTPERYLVSRLKDQLYYYQTRILRASRQRLISRFTVAGILALAFVTSLLQKNIIAAPFFVAIAITLVMGVLGAVGIRQLEEDIRIWEIVVRKLAVVDAWWRALSSDEKAEQKNIDQLVTETEDVLKIVWQIPAVDATAWVTRHS